MGSEMKREGESQELEEPLSFFVGTIAPTREEAYHTSRVTSQNLHRNSQRTNRLKGAVIPPQT